MGNCSPVLTLLTRQCETVRCIGRNPARRLPAGVETTPINVRSTLPEKRREGSIRRSKQFVWGGRSASVKGIVAAPGKAYVQAWHATSLLQSWRATSKQKTQRFRKTLCPFGFVVACVFVDSHQQAPVIKAGVPQTLLQRTHIFDYLSVSILAA
jgi:hypothetical protein